MFTFNEYLGNQRRCLTSIKDFGFAVGPGVRHWVANAVNALEVATTL